MHHLRGNAILPGHVLNHLSDYDEILCPGDIPDVF